MIEVPYFLYVTEHRGIYTYKILKLIYKQCKTLLFGQFYQIVE